MEAKWDDKITGYSWLFGPELYLFLASRPNIVKFSHESKQSVVGYFHKIKKLPLVSDNPDPLQARQEVTKALLDCYVNGVVYPMNINFSITGLDKYPVLEIDGEEVDRSCLKLESEYFVRFQNEDTIS